MAQTKNYTTKKKGKTEVQPYWNCFSVDELAIQ